MKTKGSFCQQKPVLFQIKEAVSLTGTSCFVLWGPEKDSIKELIADMIVGPVDDLTHDGFGSDWIWGGKGEMIRSSVVVLFLWIMSALSLGCQKGKALEDYIPRDIDRRLVKAAIQGDIRKMDAAIKDGADPNASDERGTCLLKIAYFSGNKSGFEHLLELGADPHHIDKNGSRLIHFIAGNREDSDWINMILKHGGDPNCLQEGRLPQFPGAEGRLAKVNTDTPIFNACMAQNLESVRILVKYGADPNAIGIRDRSVAILSAHAGSPVITKWLLENGADWRGRDVDDTDVAEAELYREYDPVKEPEKTAAQKWILDFLKQKGVDLKVAEENSRKGYGPNFRATPGKVKVYDKLPDGVPDPAQ